jgi:hypothetical protein
MKKPSPWIIMSPARPVVSWEPCDQLDMMPALRTPRPTCAGLVPPWPFCGAPAAPIIWLSVSWNWTTLAL